MCLIRLINTLNSIINYGDNIMEHLDYSIYISYTEQANELTTKRQTINSIYITINSALIGFIASSFGSVGIALSCIGFVTSFIWMMLLISYRKLSKAKFQVIESMEKNMEFKPYYEEWQHIKRQKYLNLTILETISSVIFLVGFIVLFVISIIN